MPDAARFWDRRADRYARSPIKDMASYEQGLERARAHLAPSDVALEVGCGTGTTALRLAPAVRSLLATDVSPRMIEIAREKAAAAGVPNVRFEPGTLFDEKLEPGSFDVVLAFNLLHLIEDVDAALARVHTLLAPGGRFISKTICIGEQSGLWGWVLPVMRLVGLAPFVRFFRIAELESLVAGAGLDVVETGSYPASPPSRLIVARKA